MVSFKTEFSVFSEVLLKIHIGYRHYPSLLKAYMLYSATVRSPSKFLCSNLFTYLRSKITQ